MKITVVKKGIKTVTDTKKARYPYQYRDAIKSMLLLDGLDECTVSEIFNQYPDVKGASPVKDFILEQND